MIRHGRKIAIAAAAGLMGGGLMATGAMAAEPQLVWKAEGLDAPESVVLDSEAGVFYVSNVNGKPTDVDGNGYISRLSLKGEILDQKWVDGLDAPKGLALHQGKLYVSDITKLVVIDTASGEISASYDAPESSFLNDVTVHPDGRVFASDMVENQIWMLEDGELSLWLEDEALLHPNGLSAEADRLLVVSWGVPKGGASAEVLGHMKAVDYQSKAIEDLGDQPVGNLDGLKSDGKGGYLVTDWVGGALYRFSAAGKAERILDLNQGSADLTYVESDHLVVIPMMMDGAVAAYKVE